MARQKGANNFAGTLEVLAAAPLDARSIVPTKADLTASANFPYPYVGMEVYVTAENKKYRLTANDPTILSNWEEVGAGGAGGGHTIEDPEGTALTQRDTLQFGGDLEVSDDDENEKTVVAPHELTAAELAEIVTPLPSVPVNMPILFDETGTERVVGWYKYANGTKKPIYEKSFYSSETVISGTNIPHGVANIDSAWITSFYIRDVNNRFYLMEQFASSNGKVVVDNTNVGIFFANGNWSASNGYHITLRYTKTTDTPT